MAVRGRTSHGLLGFLCNFSGVTRLVSLSFLQIAPIDVDQDAFGFR
jgi:hypothetical protein